MRNAPILSPAAHGTDFVGLAFHVASLRELATL
jgi:hypothetical protein